MFPLYLNMKHSHSLMVKSGHSFSSTDELFPYLYKWCLIMFTAYIAAGREPNTYNPIEVRVLFYATRATITSPQNIKHMSNTTQLKPNRPLLENRESVVYVYSIYILISFVSPHHQHGSTALRISSCVVAFNCTLFQSVQFSFSIVSFHFSLSSDFNVDGTSWIAFGRIIVFLQFPTLTSFFGAFVWIE